MSLLPLSVCLSVQINIDVFSRKGYAALKGISSERGGVTGAADRKWEVSQGVSGAEREYSLLRAKVKA